MKAILFSKGFNPGHISYLQASAKLLRERGFEVQFCLNQRFLTGIDSEFTNFNVPISSIFKLSPGDLFVATHPSLWACLCIILIRLFGSATSIYVYHEPFTSIASYRKAGFGIVKTLKIIFVSYVSKLSSKFSDKVILPSSRAYFSLTNASLNPAKYAKINLMFCDEVEEGLVRLPRIFVSYIGTIAPDHAFSDFLKLVYSCIRNDCLTDYTFLIASRSKIPDDLSDLVEHCISSGRLIVQSGEIMTVSQINNFYARSLLVWNAYKRSMQSGVLPMAYMFGTPVLISASNQSEYFKDFEHGIMLSEKYTFNEFLVAVSQVQTNWQEMSRSCRNSFLEFFYYRTLSDDFFHFVSLK